MENIVSMELTQESLTNNLLVWEDPELGELFKVELRDFFQAYIEQNTAFSRGDFQRGGAYNVYFIPTSQSYTSRGSYITVINPTSEHLEDVILFNTNQGTTSKLVRKYAIIYGEEDHRAVVTFDIREVYHIEHR